MPRLFPWIALAVCCGASPAAAETFVCDFTEPFFTLKYSTVTQRLTRLEDSPKGQRVSSVQKNVSFQIVGPGSFVLKDRKANVIMTLEHTNKGSAGMGDTVYPYEVKMAETGGGANGGVGGCSSSLLKPKEPPPDAP